MTSFRNGSIYNFYKKYIPITEKPSAVYTIIPDLNLLKIGRYLMDHFQIMLIPDNLLVFLNGIGVNYKAFCYVQIEI